jgi:hypothetical protein
MAAGNATFMTPDITLSSGELVDVEFQRLGIADVVGVEIYVIDKVVGAIGEHMVVVGQSYR